MDALHFHPWVILKGRNAVLVMNFHLNLNAMEVITVRSFQKISFLVTFEGNELTTLQRATDLAILHYTQLALNSGFTFIFITIAERSMVTSVSASNGNAFTSNYPMASIYCSITDTKTGNSIEDTALNFQLKSKYKIQ